MEKLVGKNIMNICKSKIKEAINNINCYAEKIRKDKSYNKKIESLNNQDAINEGEKFKLDILFQIHTGRKLYQNKRHKVYAVFKCIHFMSFILLFILKIMQK